MGFGFIVTILLLAVVLGLFSKQALLSENERIQRNEASQITVTPAEEEPINEANEVTPPLAPGDDSDRPHAI